MVVVVVAGAVMVAVAVAVVETEHAGYAESHCRSRDSGVIAGDLVLDARTNGGGEKTICAWVCCLAELR